MQSRGALSIKVSVVISTYNRPDYLTRVIEGYLSQTRLPDEIIIADDGSRDDTAAMVAALRAAANVPIVHVWHEDRGFRAARIRNKAVARSSGQYIILCDDDCIPAAALVEDHLRYSRQGCFIQGHRVLLGAGISDSFSLEDRSLLRLLDLARKGQANNIKNALRLPLPLVRISQSLRGIRSCNMSFYRNDFIAVNGFNEDFEGWGKEDSELAVRLYKYGLKRKDLKFRACCYHLFHPYYDRDNLERNIGLLEKAQVASGYFCSNGVDKYL